MKVASATPVLFVDRAEPTRDFFLSFGFLVAFEPPSDVRGYEEPGGNLATFAKFARG